MALEHAILVSLSEQSSSGYDLARRFDRSIGFFWSATHQQIYKVLRRMEADGWVAAHVVEQAGRPAKKVHELTDAGRGELRRWLADPADLEVTRSELAVKLRGAADGDMAAVLADVRRHRDIHAARLDAYLVNEKHEFPAPSRLAGRSLHQYLVLRGGIRYEQGAIHWRDEILYRPDSAR